MSQVLKIALYSTGFKCKWDKIYKTLFKSPRASNNECDVSSMVFQQTVILIRYKLSYINAYQTMYLLIMLYVYLYTNKCTYMNSLEKVACDSAFTTASNSSAAYAFPTLQSSNQFYGLCTADV